MLEKEVFDKPILCKIFKIFKNIVALYYGSVIINIWQQFGNKKSVSQNKI